MYAKLIDEVLTINNLSPLSRSAVGIVQKTKRDNLHKMKGR